jgi:hypothetical protein
MNWKALERMCIIVEDHEKFYSEAKNACSSISPDIQISKKMIEEVDEE